MDLATVRAKRQERVGLGRERERGGGREGGRKGGRKGGRGERERERERKRERESRLRRTKHEDILNEIKFALVNTNIAHITVAIVQ